MRNLLINLALIMFGTSSFAADKPEYAVSNIPDELKKNADYVVREEKIEFSVSSPGKAYSKVKVVYTIFNKRAADKAEIVLSYDKIRKIKSLRGASYDPFGKQNATLKAGQILDHSYTSDGTFVDDLRLKYAVISIPSYPYTIEYEYEYEFVGIISYKDWQPRRGPKISVQQSEFSIVAPESIPIRYKQVFLDCVFEESVAKGIKTYKWQVKNLPAINDAEPYSRGYSKYNPVLLTAPIEFEYLGYNGNMETWQNLGKWVYQLNQGRDMLPDESKANLLKMTEGMSDHEKIAKIYKYLQSKTRYVGIQLGIGGFQPAEASFVDKVGYGDCKGLTNYMMAMLNAVGIKSYYTLVNAGPLEPDIITDFVDNQFNHAILCVPLHQDSIWLECTSQNQPFGFLGKFTANRHALMISEEGGKLVKTQTFCDTLNFQTRFSEVKMDLAGNITAAVESNYGGYQSDVYSNLRSISHEKQKKWYYENLALNGLEIQDFSFDVKDNPNGEVNEKLKLNVKRYASISGKRIFIAPNLMSRENNTLPELENRLSQIEMRYPYVSTDTVKILLPQSYYPEFIPEAKQLKYDFGEYSSKAIPAEGNITYIRVMKIFGGSYPADKYKELQEFFKEIEKADNSKIILINET